MTSQPVYLSTRFLSLFKGLVYALVVIALGFAGWMAWHSDWSTALLIANVGLFAYIIVRGLRKLRTVLWEGGHLVVKDQADVIILPEEVKSLELKALIGIHEVTLYEPHPYLGESFLFLASLNYLWSHNRVDDQMHTLRQHIAQCKREMTL